MPSSFDKLQVYILSEGLADQIWDAVVTWEGFARDTVGRQIVRAADSVGANLAEGTSGTFVENCKYIRIARGSLYETRHFLRRAYHRHLLTKVQVEKLKSLVAELDPRLNAYLNAVKKRLGRNRKEINHEPPTMSQEPRAKNT